MLSTVIPLVMLLIPAGTSARPYPAAPQAVRQDTLRVKEEKPGYRAEAKITGDAAMRSALKRVPGGRMESAELEKEKGRLVYSFDIVAPHKTGIEEILVDARSGEVVSQQHESPAAEAKEHDDEKHHDSSTAEAKEHDDKQHESPSEEAKEHDGEQHNSR